MIFSPHILKVKTNSEDAVDEYGHPIVSDDSEKWETVCKCRCDDNDTKEFKTDNGGVFRPSFHIVCDGVVSVKADDEIQCLSSDGSVRGSGKVYMVKKTNYFNYSELWV